MSALWEKFKALPTEYKAGSLFIILALVACVAAWYDNSHTDNNFHAASPIKGTDVPKVEKKITKGTIKVIPKKTVKDATGLPSDIENNDEIEITATAEVPPSETGSKTMATINTNTGDTEILVKPNPVPFFAFENKRRVGVGYGIGSEGTTAKVFGEWTFVRAMNAHVGVQTELNATQAKSPEAKALAVIDYRW